MEIQDDFSLLQELVLGKLFKYKYYQLYDPWRC